MRRYRLAEWGREFLADARYKVLYGGRGGGKSRFVAALLVLEAAQQPLRVACVREFQRSIAESSKRVIEGRIEEFGLGGFYSVQRDHIHGRNGSHFFFRGMSTATEEAVRGWEDVDRVWMEEAQRMSHRSREILYPTIRKPGSQLIFTFNPRYRADPVWQDFIVNRPDNAIVKRINYDDNDWFPPELEEERARCLRYEPERYDHIWRGEPDDEGEQKLVLPYGLIEPCVGAHVRLKIGAEVLAEGRMDAGLDVADTGANKNALVLRRGPLVSSVEQWSAGTLGDTVRRAHATCRDAGVRRLHYDAGGVGGGVRSYFHDLAKEREYYADPVLFGGTVKGPDREYSYRVSNREYFVARNAQLAWALRLRALNTQRLIKDGDGDPARCLFISEMIPQLHRYLDQLAQPVWDETATGRMRLDKTPEDMPSPDMFDATALAFAWDSHAGLQAR